MPLKCFCWVCGLLKLCRFTRFLSIKLSTAIQSATTNCCFAYGIGNLIILANRKQKPYQYKEDDGMVYEKFYCRGEEKGDFFTLCCFDSILAIFGDFYLPACPLRKQKNLNDPFFLSLELHRLPDFRAHLLLIQCDWCSV